MYNFLKGKTALYIEDELDVLRNISTLLRNFFQELYIAVDGESGYQLFLEKKIDVLLIDIELPKMNGIDFIKKVRETNKDIPIIIISAYTKTDYLLESIDLDIDKYIVKPLTSKKIHELLTRLDSHFSDDDIQELVTNITLHKRKSTLCVYGFEYPLTKRELGFLNILADKKTIHYDECQALWEDVTPSKNAIRSFIKQLRKKLPADLIKNNNQIGYFIETNKTPH